MEDLIAGFRTGFTQLDAAPELQLTAPVTTDQRELLRRFTVDAATGRALRVAMRDRVRLAVFSTFSMLDGIGGPLGPSDLEPRRAGVAFSWHDEYHEQLSVTG